MTDPEINDPLLTRDQIVEVRPPKLGIPIAKSTIDKAAMDGTGPEPAGALRQKIPLSGKCRPGLGPLSPFPRSRLKKPPTASPWPAAAIEGLEISMNKSKLARNKTRSNPNKNNNREIPKKNFCNFRPSPCRMRRQRKFTQIQSCGGAS